MNDIHTGWVDLCGIVIEFADDHSRVILDKIEEDVDSDYINACYIDVRLYVELFKSTDHSL